MALAGPTRYRAVVPTSRSDGCTLGPPATARWYRPLDPMVVLWAHPLSRGDTDLSIRWLYFGPTRYRAVVPTSRSDGRSWALLRRA